MLARDDGFDLHPRCAQRFDDATREGHYFDCAQCSEKVLDLSSLTHREYARWRERPRDGAKATCVRAKVDAAGRIVLADEPAPRRRLPVLPALIAATVSAGCERPPAAPEAPVASAGPRAPAPAVAPAVASAVTPSEAIDAPAPSADPSLTARTDTRDAGPARADAAVVDGPAIVRLRHPHPPRRHRGRAAPTQAVEEFAGMPDDGVH